MRPDTIKILQESRDGELLDSDFRDEFLDWANKQIATTTTKNPSGNLSNLCIAKEAIDKKNQPTKWEQIIANDTSDKELLSYLNTNICINIKNNSKNSLKLRQRSSMGIVSAGTTQKLTGTSKRPQWG